MITTVSKLVMMMMTMMMTMTMTMTMTMMLLKLASSMKGDSHLFCLTMHEFLNSTSMHRDLLRCSNISKYLFHSLIFDRSPKCCLPAVAISSHFRGSYPGLIFVFVFVFVFVFLFVFVFVFVS